MSFLLTLTKRARNERTKRNFFKNTLPAASDRAGYCHGHGLGLPPPLRRSHSRTYPGNTGHKSAWPASPAKPSQRHRAAPAAAFLPEAFPVSGALTGSHFQCRCHSSGSNALAICEYDNASIIKLFTSAGSIYRRTGNHFER